MLGIVLFKTVVIMSIPRYSPKHVLRHRPNKFRYIKLYLKMVLSNCKFYNTQLPRFSLIENDHKYLNLIAAN